MNARTRNKYKSVNELRWLAYLNYKKINKYKKLSDFLALEELNKNTVYEMSK